MTCHPLSHTAKHTLFQDCFKGTGEEGNSELSASGATDRNPFTLCIGHVSDAEREREIYRYNIDSNS